MNIEELREFCLSLPGVTEDVKWGNDLCFLIGEKMFCVTGLEGEHMITFKVNNEEYDELCQRPGIVPAPYLARYKWVGVTELSSLSIRDLQRYIEGSYELIKAKLPQRVKQQFN